MIATHLSQFERPQAQGLCLQFILHEYATSLLIATKSPIINWGQLVNDRSQGSIDKLSSYCRALVEHIKVGEDLLCAVEDLRAALLLYLRKLPFIAQAAPFDIEKKLIDLFPPLRSLLKQCAESEAAFFALLELRKTLNLLLGPQTVELLLQEVFPLGPEEFRQKLSSAFGQRGFANFCEQHNALFEGLIWPSNSHQTS